MIPTEVLTSTHVTGNSCPVQIAIGVDPLPVCSKKDDYVLKYVIIENLKLIDNNFLL